LISPLERAIPKQAEAVRNGSLGRGRKPGGLSVESQEQLGNVQMLRCHLSTLSQTCDK
jgi:hypothetical protein